MAGALDGYRILDLTTMVSGPFATMILGDQGADVIKVEVPGSGDHVRALGHRMGGLPATFLNINRNKRSITLNLKSERGVELLKELAKTADVLVQNFRPGVVDRIGVGDAAIRAVKADIIYVSISGFGETGPYSQKPVYDPVIQALTGLTTIQAGSDQERPRLVRTILPDKLSAVTASQAITAALLARERTGKGQHVKLSMLDSVLSFLWASDMGGQTFVEHPASNQAAASFIDLLYETKDGHMTVAVMNDKEWRGLSRAFEMPKLLEDERFKSPALRDKNINARLDLIQDVLRTRNTAEWMRRFEREGVPCAPALTRNEVIDHPQITAADSLIEVSHPVAGQLRQARPAAQFGETPSKLRLGAPRLGEHNEEIFADLGLSEAEIAELQRAGVIGNEKATYEPYVQPNKRQAG